MVVNYGPAIKKGGDLVHGDDLDDDDDVIIKAMMIGKVISST